VFCDLRESLWLADPGEAVALLGEADPGRLGRAGDVLVAVADDLGAERRMAGHLDRDVAPLGIHDVERVVVDVGLLLAEVADRAARRAFHLPDRRRRLRHEDQEDTGCDRVSAEVVLGDPVLALAPAAVDDAGSRWRWPTRGPDG